MVQCCEWLQPQGIKDGSDWEGQRKGQQVGPRRIRNIQCVPALFSSSLQAFSSACPDFSRVLQNETHLSTGFTAVEEVSLDERRRLYNARPRLTL